MDFYILYTMPVDNKCIIVIDWIEGPLVYPRERERSDDWDTPQGKSQFFLFLFIYHTHSSKRVLHFCKVTALVGIPTVCVQSGKLKV